MEQRVKADKIPAQAHRLYVQLYCERKGEKDKKTIQEAKKSWMSLSQNKKDLFYKTTANRNLLNYAHGLSKSKIYLKTKGLHENVSNLQQSNDEDGRELEHHETVASIDESCLGENETQLREEDKSINGQTLNNTEVEEDGETLEVNTGSPLCDTTQPNHVEEMEDTLELQSNTPSIQSNKVTVAEPTPPTIRVGKELYEMIKRPGNPEWTDLSKVEKAHYNSAVRTIKREYIKSYTTYLESLTQKQLFDHYMKIF